MKYRGSVLESRWKSLIWHEQHLCLLLVDRDYVLSNKQVKKIIYLRFVLQDNINIYINMILIIYYVNNMKNVIKGVTTETGYDYCIQW